MTTTNNIEDRRKELLVYYQFCEPVETLFYKTLRDHYPEMSVTDIVVCRAAYIADTTGGLGLYERRYVWSWHTVPQEEWALYLLENSPLLLPPKMRCRNVREAEELIQLKTKQEGYREVLSTPIFPTEYSLQYAVGLAQARGYITAPKEQVNQDIQKLLDDKLAQAVKTQDYVSDEQVFQHEREEAEFNAGHGHQK